MAFSFAKPWYEAISEVSTRPEYQTAVIRIEDPSLVTSTYDIETGEYTNVGDPVIYSGQARVIGVRWGVQTGGESQANATTISTIRVQIPRGAVSRVKRGCKVYVESAPNPVLTSYIFTVTSDMQGASDAARTFECALDLDVQVPPTQVDGPFPGDLFTSEDFAVDGDFYASGGGGNYLRETATGQQWLTSPSTPLPFSALNSRNAGTAVAGKFVDKDELGDWSVAIWLVAPSDKMEVAFDYHIEQTTGRSAHARLAIAGYVVHVNPSGSNVRLLPAAENTVVASVAFNPPMTGRLSAKFDGFSLLVSIDGTQIAEWSLPAPSGTGIVGMSIPSQGGWGDNFEVRYA